MCTDARRNEEPSADVALHQDQLMCSGTVTYVRRLRPARTNTCSADYLTLLTIHLAFLFFFFFFSSTSPPSRLRGEQRHRPVCDAGQHTLGFCIV